VVYFSLEWDIETSHMIVTTFQLFEASPSCKDILQDWYIFCGAWKWFDSNKVHVTSVIDFPEFKPFTAPARYPTIDKGVVETLHRVLSEADAVIGHNSGRGFTRTRTTKRQRFQCNDCGSWSSKPAKAMAR